MTDIASRLKNARNAAGLTQPELAARAGVSKGTIGNLEAGTRQAPRKLLAIAAALGVNPHWLETGKGPREAGQALPPPAIPVDLSEALQALGMALAMDMPDDVRQDAADILSKLAERRGSERHQRELVQLLMAGAQSRKRVAA